MLLIPDTLESECLLGGLLPKGLVINKKVYRSILVTYDSSAMTKFGRVLLFSALTVLATVSSGAEAGSSASGAVSVSQGVVSVNSNAIFLETVLQELARLAGFELIIDGVLPKVPVQRLSNVPIEDAIRRLIGDRTLVIVHNKDGNEEKLSTVRVYSGVANSSRRAPKISRDISKEASIDMQPPIRADYSLVEIPALDALPRFSHPQGSPLHKDPWGLFLPSSPVIEQAQKRSRESARRPSGFMGQRIWKDPSLERREGNSSNTSPEN